MYRTLFGISAATENWSGGSIRFTYEARYAGGGLETGHGLFRRAGRRFILTVDDAEYVVRRKET
jgi:hypothetical protein